MTFAPTNATDAPDWSGQPGIGGFVMGANLNASFPFGNTMVGPWYVGNVAASIIKFFFGSTLNDAVTAYWWQEQEMIHQINSVAYKKGGKTWTVDCVPNYGPWLSLNFNVPSGGTEVGCAYIVSGVPVYNYYGQVGQWAGNEPGILLQVPFQSVAAGVTLSVQGGSFVPGPADVFFYTDHGSAELLIEATAGTFANNHLGGYALVGNPTACDTKEILLPYDDWRIQITNRGSSVMNTMAAVLTKR